MFFRHAGRSGRISRLVVDGAEIGMAATKNIFHQPCVEGHRQISKSDLSSKRETVACMIVLSHSDQLERDCGHDENIV